MAGGWSRLHYEKLNDLYSSAESRLIESKSIRWGGECSTNRKMINTSCGKKILGWFV